MTQKDLGVRAALWLIQKQSPFCFMVEHKTDTTRTEATLPTWNPPEAGLAWAIFERAVHDSHGFGTKFGKNSQMSRKDGEYARETATTGYITMDGGHKYNILEALGIEPEWAARVIADVAQRFDSMEAA